MVAPVSTYLITWIIFKATTQRIFSCLRMFKPPVWVLPCKGAPSATWVATWITEWATLCRLSQEKKTVKAVDIYHQGHYCLPSTLEASPINKNDYHQLSHRAFQCTQKLVSKTNKQMNKKGTQRIWHHTISFYGWPGQQGREKGPKHPCWCALPGCRFRFEH